MLSSFDSTYAIIPALEVPNVSRGSGVKVQEEYQYIVSVGKISSHGGVEVSFLLSSPLVGYKSLIGKHAHDCWLHSLSIRVLYTKLAVDGDEFQDTFTV